MNFISSFRLAMIALVPAAAISFGVGSALAQSPPPAASTPAPTAPPPRPPPASPPAAPATPPAAAETPAAPPPAAAPVQAADPFGEEITLAPKTVVIMKGNDNWDSAVDT